MAEQGDSTLYLEGSRMRTTVPLAERRSDGIFIAFWVLNLTFITYIVDIEQLVIADPAAFDYPLWPPAPLVDLVHWWGLRFDPALYARPPWWRATIWIDALLFGPFYAAAIFAYWKGREWIREPSLIWCGLMVANVTIILFEEMLGSYATPERSIVLLANAPWLIMPIATAVRMWREHPFSRVPAPAPEAHVPQAGRQRHAPLADRWVP